HEPLRDRDLDHPSEGRRVDHGVGEEAPGASTVRIRGVEHHALLLPERVHRSAYLRERRAGPARGRELAVANRWRAALFELEGDGEHDEAPGLALEAALAVAELALLAAEHAATALDAIEDLDRDEAVAHLLAVGAHVLDG